MKKRSHKKEIRKNEEQVMKNLLLFFGLLLRKIL